MLANLRDVILILLPLQSVQRLHVQSVCPVSLTNLIQQRCPQCLARSPRGGGTPPWPLDQLLLTLLQQGCCLLVQAFVDQSCYLKRELADVLILMEKIFFFRLVLVHGHIDHLPSTGRSNGAKGFRCCSFWDTSSHRLRCSRPLRRVHRITICLRNVSQKLRFRLLHKLRLELLSLRKQVCSLFLSAKLVHESSNCRQAVNVSLVPGTQCRDSRQRKLHRMF
mmetsp:Transcript_22875/g.50205  ORF Transcript_22875/g.50205 Transcript_22875/m.50205 type:complete len:222 (+) Transcript_22875:1036-1701(+)